MLNGVFLIPVYCVRACVCVLTYTLWVLCLIRSCMECVREIYIMWVVWWKLSEWCLVRHQASGIKIDIHDTEHYSIYISISQLRSHTHWLTRAFTYTHVACTYVHTLRTHTHTQHTHARAHTHTHILMLSSLSDHAWRHQCSAVWGHEVSDHSWRHTGHWNRESGIASDSRHSMLWPFMGLKQDKAKTPI
jgi:hypothetical protein